MSCTWDAHYQFSSARLRQLYLVTDDEFIYQFCYFAANYLYSIKDLVWKLGHESLYFNEAIISLESLLIDFPLEIISK
jgi:hypothetical protein